jgi:hypothetical protein
MNPSEPVRKRGFVLPLLLVAVSLAMLIANVPAFTLGRSASLSAVLILASGATFFAAVGLAVWRLIAAPWGRT